MVPYSQAYKADLEKYYQSQTAGSNQPLSDEQATSLRLSILRELIDHVIPEGDIRRLNVLALALIAIPLLTGLIEVVERYFSSRAGEGIIYDLRLEMYSHLQRMALRFFT